TQKLPADPGKVRLRVQVKKIAANWPQKISGLAIQQSGTERLGYSVDLSLGSDTTVAAANTSGSPTTTLASGRPAVWRMLFYAFIGGLILNIMPCVLPVIALKILGFVRDAHQEGNAALKLGIIYTLGVLASFLVLALIAIGLQAAGKGA